jgi:hypothetical protein
VLTAIYMKYKCGDCGGLHGHGQACQPFLSTERLRAVFDSNNATVQQAFYDYFENIMTAYFPTPYAPPAEAPAQPDASACVTRDANGTYMVLLKERKSTPMRRKLRTGRGVQASLLHVPHHTKAARGDKQEQPPATGQTVSVRGERRSIQSCANRPENPPARRQPPDSQPATSTAQASHPPLKPLGEAGHG